MDRKVTTGQSDAEAAAAGVVNQPKITVGFEVAKQMGFRNFEMRTSPDQPFIPINRPNSDSDSK